MARQSKRKKRNSYFSLLLVLILSLVGGGWAVQKQHPTQPQSQTSEKITNQSQTAYGTVNDLHPSLQLANTVMTANVKQQLASSAIQFNGTGAFIINNNHNDLNTNVASAIYVNLSPLDNLQRPGVANAWLSRSARQYKNRVTTGNADKIEPLGWHQLKIAGKYQYLYNRGHSVGYAIAGNVAGFDASEANVQNITTQTAWANQASNGDSNNTGQNYYEGLVRKALDQNKRVRYKVTPIYDGNNIVPAGNWLMAKSSDGSLEFNVFVPNVQPGVEINYVNGNAKLVK
ncbi:DNA-entry nuclease [Weissella oryzae SG25]|uniref:DNA-entry nuclease n=1 Tax=Weissella oryzae (strain DSM 25784 / JCM 18191 / LMG 30913 / SG25) TaxID=1329250 RepID=A0A069CWV7_WEIOS|nr:DNA/RNA non-specific endonuclease [Weissella oryzae]GAK31847.1 DNA-entry nuclease [Weissella oryzae SG25]